LSTSSTRSKAPVGAVLRNGRVLMESGELLRRPSLAPRGAGLYAVRRLDDPDVEIHWKGNRVSAYLEGRAVRYLHRTFQDQAALPTNAELVEGLAGWRDWLWENRVSAAASPNRIADQLWHRTSIGRRLPNVDSTPDPPFLGPRFHRPRHFYIEEGQSWAWDLAGAYAWAASVCHYPADGWERCSTWSGHPFAIVYGQVEMPPREDPQPGTIPEPRPLPMGAPFNIDYAAAKARRPYTAHVFLLGGELLSIADRLPLQQVLASWEPRGPFLALCRPGWTDAIVEGRTLPGVAGRLAKRTGNALWGSLAAHGSYKRVNYRTGKYTLSGALRPRSEVVASIIVARVRVRLWLEALCAMPVIFGHTDSAVVPEGYRPAGPIDNGLGSWKLKERLYDLQAFGVNSRRYRESPERGSPWIYVMAGERGAQAERIFGQKLRRWLDPDAQDPPIGDRTNGYHRWR
jgi:hypothetical protein